MNEQTLPGIHASIAPPSSPRIPPDPPRLLCAERRQIRLLPMDLESRLAADHPARSIWTLVEKLGLSVFENSIKSRGEGAGCPAFDPRILVTLWVFATSEGVGSARELEELCGVHDAYRWICGGVPVCAHTLRQAQRPRVHNGPGSQRHENGRRWFPSRLECPALNRYRLPFHRRRRRGRPGQRPRPH
ncbi:MAG: transposase [Planctomycetes bacterium]|nr:transposase [Planctomycetota bacterium]